MMETNTHHHYLSQKRCKKRLSNFLFNMRNLDQYNSIGITLTMSSNSRFGEKLDEITSSKNFRFFMNRLEQKTLRNRKSKKGLKIQRFPIIEKGSNQRIHYHVLMEIPNKYHNRRNEFEKLIKDSWLKTPYGLREMKIKPLNNKNGWKEYITKFIGKDDEIDLGNLHWIG